MNNGNNGKNGAEIVPVTGFIQHVLLYAKFWYKEDGEIQTGKDMDNLKILLARWSAIDVEHISDKDIWEFILQAMTECCKPRDLAQGLLEMIDEKYPKESLFQRSKIHVALGQLSIVDGKYIDKQVKLLVPSSP